MVNQSNEPDGTIVPYKEKIARLLGFAGVEILSDDSQNYDALLRIEAKGKAMGRKYKKSGYLYTGGMISGKIVFELNGESSVQSFNIHYEPWDIDPVEAVEYFKNLYSEQKEASDIFINTYRTPSSALTSLAFGAQHSLGEKLALIIYKYFGVKPLLKAFQDKDGDIVNAVEWGLIETKDKDAVEALCDMLRSKKNTTEFSYRIISVLGEMGNPRATEVLLETLKDENEWLRGASIVALGKLKAREAVEPLSEILRKSNEPTLSRVIIESLGEIGDERAIDVLSGYLKSDDKNLRYVAVQALGKVRSTRSAELLLPLLKDADINIAFQALSGLAEMGAPAIPVIMKALKTDPSLDKAKIGEIFWFRLKDPMAIGPLLSALKDDASIVREYAVSGLISIGRPAIEPLIAFLRTERDPQALGLAAAALRGITKQDFGSDPAEWEKWWLENKDKVQ